MCRVGMGGEGLGCSQSLAWEDAECHFEFILEKSEAWLAVIVMAGVLVT